MPVKEGREYRSFSLNVLEDSQGGYIVEGYATTFGEPYELYPDCYEVIDRGALDGADMSDVIFQLNHSGVVMARMRNGTLKVWCDDHGIRIRADLGGCREGRDLYEAIKNGLIDRMSWGFTVARDGWTYDEETNTSHVAKVKKVYDVSAVSMPANGGTEIHARSYLNGVIGEGEESAAQREKEKCERARIAAAIAIY